MNELKIVEHGGVVKQVRSKEYNYDFNRETGFFARCGKDFAEDPLWAPGPEIADVEISTICNMGCPYCYKSNTPQGKNMSLETLKVLITKIDTKKLLTQVAFGLGATAEENPDLWAMCDWLRGQGIIPNGTVANITDATADKISSKFGACAVSFHGSKDLCYNSVKKLTDRGMKQANIHHVIHSGNFEETLGLIHDIKTDPRLSELNAIVLLSLKVKGRAVGNAFKPLSQEKFSILASELTKSGINFGMDSCSSHKYMSFVKTTDLLTEDEKLRHTMMVEPCESQSIFSSYFNVNAEYFPCSFAEGIVPAVKVLDCKDFISEVWDGPAMTDMRNRALACNRDCLFFKI